MDFKMCEQITGNIPRNAFCRPTGRTYATKEPKKTVGMGGNRAIRPFVLVGMGGAKWKRAAYQHDASSLFAESLIQTKNTRRGYVHAAASFFEGSSRLFGRATYRQFTTKSSPRKPSLMTQTPDLDYVVGMSVGE